MKTPPPSETVFSWQDMLDLIRGPTDRLLASFGDRQAHIRLLEREVTQRRERQLRQELQRLSVLETLPAPKHAEIEPPARPAEPPGKPRRTGRQPKNPTIDGPIARRLVEEGKLKLHPSPGEPSIYKQCWSLLDEIPGNLANRTKHNRLRKAVHDEYSV
jgi:hypothetical protein